MSNDRYQPQAAASAAVRSVDRPGSVPKVENNPDQQDHLVLEPQVSEPMEVNTLDLPADVALPTAGNIQGRRDHPDLERLEEAAPMAVNSQGRPAPARREAIACRRARRRWSGSLQVLP